MLLPASVQFLIRQLQAKLKLGWGRNEKQRKNTDRFGNKWATSGCAWPFPLSIGLPHICFDPPIDCLSAACCCCWRPPSRPPTCLSARWRLYRRSSGGSRSAAGIGAVPDYGILNRTPLVSTQLRCSWERMCPFLTPPWLHADTERPLAGLQWCSFHSNCHCSTCDNMISHFSIPFSLLLAILVAGGYWVKRSRITELLLRKLAPSEVKLCGSCLSVQSAGY